MADHLPLYPAHAAVTYTASAAVTGGQVVAFTGDLEVAPTAAQGPVVGVAARDTAIGQRVAVFTGGIHKLTAAGVITAGQLVVAAAAGAVAAYSDVTHDPTDVIGQAEEAIADTATGRIRLR